MNHKSFLIFFIFTAFLLFLVALIVQAATNIDSTNKWAWNEGLGWLNHFDTNTVTVTSQKIAGYASTTSGSFVAFDCATSPNGNICGTSNFQVSNDGDGNLSGWAWSDQVGWISFWCGNDPPGNYCASANHRVTINGATGDFHNYAWNDVVGWISFNCADPGSCASSNWRVNTSWRVAAATGTLESSIFDTQLVDGAVPNSIMWLGTKPAGTNVQFQIASANATSGPWTYVGPDGTSNTFYDTPLGPNNPVKIAVSNHLNHRYFRYKVILITNTQQTASPTVDDVILNWSP